MGASSGLNETPDAGRTPDDSIRLRIPVRANRKPGNVINETVTVSIEGDFVAVSIGYGVVPKVTPIIFGPTIPPPITLLAENGGKVPLRDISLGAILDGLDSTLPETSRLLKRETGSEAVVKNGVKLNPDMAEFALQDGGNTPLDFKRFWRSCFRFVAAPPENIQFLYAIFDEGSGREFQSEPILILLAWEFPMATGRFVTSPNPSSSRHRSTIRLEVREVSDFQGELHVALHGYKVLGRRGYSYRCDSTKSREDS